MVGRQPISNLCFGCWLWPRLVLTVLNRTSATAPQESGAAFHRRDAEDCFQTTVLYNPMDMNGQNRSVAASARSCQKRCASVSGCAHFSFWGDEGCHLHDGNATASDDSPVIPVTGPPTCPQGFDWSAFQLSIEFNATGRECRPIDPDTGRPGSYLGVLFSQEAIYSSWTEMASGAGVATCGVPPCTSNPTNQESKSCTFSITFTRPASLVGLRCIGCSTISVIGSRLEQEFQVEQGVAPFFVVESGLDVVVQISISGVAPGIPSLFWREADRGQCTDDPDGLVAADPGKDCKEVQRKLNSSTPYWSCPYRDRDFSGRDVFIWQLCPLSCGNCTNATTTTSAQGTTSTTSTLASVTAAGACGSCGGMPCRYCDSTGCCDADIAGGDCWRKSPAAEVLCQDPGCPRGLIGECQPLSPGGDCMASGLSTAAVYKRSAGECCQFRDIDALLPWRACPEFQEDKVVIGPKIAREIQIIGDYAAVVGTRRSLFLVECSAFFVLARCVDVQPAGSLLVTVEASNLSFFKAATNEAMRNLRMDLPSFGTLVLQSASSNESHEETETSAEVESNVVISLQRSGAKEATIQLDGATMAAQVVSSEDLESSGRAYASVAVEGTAAAASVPLSVVQQLGGKVTLVITAERENGKRKNQKNTLDHVAPPTATADVKWAAPLVSVRLWKNGKPTHVEGLTDPILIQVSDKRVPRARCVFWNESSAEWSTAGLSIFDSEDNLTCRSTHLTLFTAIVEQLECINAMALSAESLAGVGSNTWPGTPPGVVFTMLIVGTILGLLSACFADRHHSGLVQWRDQYFVMDVPESKRRPLRLEYCQLLLASCLRVCCHPVRLAASAFRAARKTDWLEVLELHLAAVGVHSVLSVRSGLAVETLRKHLWGKQGWVENDLASVSSPQFECAVQELTQEVPTAFVEFFSSLGPFGRMWTVLRALHPLANASRYCIEMSSAKRAMLQADGLVGALFVATLFFSVTGMTISVRSPEECADNRASPLRFILLGLASASLVNTPAAIFGHAFQRGFVHSSQLGPDTLRQQLRWWYMQDFLFWTSGVAYMSFCFVYIYTFVANLSVIDHWKWTITCISVVLRFMLVQPVAFAAMVTLATAAMKRRRPDFALKGPERLRLQLPSCQASDVAGGKVKELGTRSVSIDELLEFWEKLHNPFSSEFPMPHFDPASSTSHDVVRHAIIPLSRRESLPGGGAAYASMLAGSQERLPDVMVTHNWGNTFTHLLAAILAESLGKTTYESTARQLVNASSRLSIASLRQELGRRRLRRRYWVCCFCVNQHATICDSPPPTDSHGVRIEKCSCRVPKCWSGKDCEVDKFDDMINYLTHAVPTFSQMVAVDVKFVAFTRVWCVAELVEAKKQHLKQSLIIHSASNLKQSLEIVEAFDVRDAQASVAADKERVLSKIDDKDGFNSLVKQLLLDKSSGLLTVLAPELWTDIFAQNGMDVAMHYAVDVAEVPGLIT
eukprot:TRINITY_DN48257_c0_g1_i1.p1 TRINITY_DN48257_c0_g1~~TRINITY_DN48257_c0_g1_i1.p1  ORF type:complete len:1473 (+),score=240.55 TRINITY_DN48257_c0_g1_i1:50-4468(+)